MSDKNELDIVEQLLNNETPAVVKKKKKKDSVTTYSRDESEPHVKHLDPLVKPVDASNEKRTKPFWPGDCTGLTKEQKTKCGLPDDAFICVSRLAGPNGSCCVFEPFHWIYGWGDNTADAISNCVNTIAEWRKTNAERIPILTSEWKERIEKYGHPFKFTTKPNDVKHSRPQDKNINESKTTQDILKSIGF